MTLSRKVFTIVFLGVLTSFLLLWYVVSIPSSQTERLGSISMLNIGQGDSFLITSPTGHQLLIDGGRDQSVLSELSKVLSPSDRTIDIVLATHPDADHIGGLSSVLSRYTVGLFLTSDVSSDTATETELLKTIAQKKIPAYFVRSGMALGLDDATTFSILFPDRATTHWETNTASVVGRLDIGETSALFVGDAPSSVERFLEKTNPSAIDVDVLKLGHHGSKYSSESSFLSMTSPLLALISAGVGNRYGHPAPEVLGRLSTLHIPFVSTQDHGLVVLTTDGVTWTEKDEK